jgi:hypothetical protein
MPQEAFPSPSILLLVIGLGVNVIAGTWFLFASYSADRRLAHWSQYLPILTIRLVVEHPGKCLAPFILQHIGILFFIPFLCHFGRLFDAVGGGAR